MDELEIEKRKEIPVPKYQVGDKAWKIEEGKAEEVVVSGVRIRGRFSSIIGTKLYSLEYYTEYSDHDYTNIGQKDLFDTKEDLIKSL